MFFRKTFTLLRTFLHFIRIFRSVSNFIHCHNVIAITAFRSALRKFLNVSCSKYNTIYKLVKSFDKRENTFLNYCKSLSTWRTVNHERGKVFFHMRRVGGSFIVVSGSLCLAITDKLFARWRKQRRKRAFLCVAVCSARYMRHDVPCIYFHVIVTPWPSRARSGLHFSFHPPSRSSRGRSMRSNKNISSKFTLSGIEVKKIF